MRRSVLAFVAIALFVQAAVAERRVIQLPGSDVGLPFSPAVAAGDFVYLSGALGNEPGTLDVVAGTEAQVVRTFDNLAAVLKAADVDFSRVVDAHVYLADARHFATFNEVWKRTLQTPPPARTTVEADIALRDAQIEISMVAAKKGVEIRTITPEGWPRDAPFSWGKLAGDTLFIAGQVSLDPLSGKVVEGDAGRQTEQALANIGTVLGAAGLSYDNVASCRVYLADARDFQTMNEAYRKVFGAAPPTRETVRARLANPALIVEVQCVAVRGERQVVSPQGWPASRSPLSAGVAVGDRLFLSGMVGRGKDGFPTDVSTQTRVVFDRLASTLAAAGLTFDDVVDATVYLSDVRFYDEMNAVYRQFFKGAPSARATVGTQLMTPAALVEISMTAARQE